MGAWRIESGADEDRSGQKLEKKGRTQVGGLLGTGGCRAIPLTHPSGLASPEGRRAGG